MPTCTPALVINDPAIRFTDDKLVNLTDFWKAGSGDPSKKPAQWLKTDAAKAFIAELGKGEDIHLIQITRGRFGGTFAHWQIALAYAKYLSPEFHIHCNNIIRRFVEEEQNPDMAVDRATSQNTSAIFSNPDLFSGNLRVIMQGDDPWFVANDVADALALGNIRSSLALLDEEEKGVHTVDTPGGLQQVTLINESGLYSLILRSRKPEALRFKKWVTSEVLPSIRKTGGYLVARPDESPEVILARAVLVAQDTIERMKAKAAALEAEVKELAPKAETYDAVVAQRMMKVHDFARRLHGVNSNRTKDDLRRLGYLHRQWGPYRVYAQYRDKFFVEKVNDQNGTVDIYVTDAGKQLMTRLYNEGKLTMRVGF